MRSWLALLLPSGVLGTCGVLLVTNTRPSGSGNVVKYSQCTGAYLGELISSGNPGNLVEPDTMVIGPDGMLYITSGITPEESAVKKFDPDSGEFLGDFASGNGMRRPYGIAFDADGILYVASFRSDQLLCAPALSPMTHSLLCAGHPDPALTRPGRTSQALRPGRQLPQ
jgi:hypothetical protein